ncbi:MAG: hypothetical protein KAI14_05570, partial [Dehalococcoidales bacterium]|nr:hypothetical protein [Dehalococcoidales bacterium]
MKNKLMLLLVLGLLVSVLAACGGATVLGDGEYPTPHALTLGFENCLLCHTGGLYAMPDDAIHMVGNELCALPGCHPQADGIITTTTPTTTPTTTEPTT